MRMLPRRRLALVAIPVGALAILAGSGRAQVPVCDLASAETVTCFAGRLCTCRLGRGSEATGLPQSFRWDCGILRPQCGGPLPAAINPYVGPLPEALAIERNETNITNFTGRNHGKDAPGHRK